MGFISPKEAGNDCKKEVQVQRESIKEESDEDSESGSETELRLSEEVAGQEFNGAL